AALRRKESLRGPACLRTRCYREDGLSRLLPDRRRLHQMGEVERHSSWAGTRFWRRLGRGLVADDYGPRSYPFWTAVRALPEPRTRVDAGLRYRLLPGAAR